MVHRDIYPGTEPLVMSRRVLSAGSPGNCTQKRAVRRRKRCLPSFADHIILATLSLLSLALVPVPSRIQAFTTPTLCQSRGQSHAISQSSVTAIKRLRWPFSMLDLTAPNSQSGTQLCSSRSPSINYKNPENHSVYSLLLLR
jgi:hypothetical protein